MTLPRVYPIVDSAAWIRRLLPAGVRLVQLRVKDRSVQELRAQIRESRDLCVRAGAQLVVNDHWRLALEEACDFVHLGQGDLDTADAPALRRAGVRIGISTHDEAELARALSYQPDYVALGPIYPTLLKVMAFAPQGLARIGEWKRRIGAIPLVAIGGITLERLPGVLAAGADCAAVVTDIVRNAEPERHMQAWVSAVSSSRTPHGVLDPRERPATDGRAGGSTGTDACGTEST
ncbi:MAG TPA: thiamine phosphate synthase [Steroidobacteraceae bacterium]|nr:thiamine phosphate synthase [Steroidobacteraceae bacterium]